MATGDSFDPRTWIRGRTLLNLAPDRPTAAEPTPARREGQAPGVSWLALALSAALLAAGALAAYATREAANEIPALPG